MMRTKPLCGVVAMICAAGAACGPTARNDDDNPTVPDAGPTRSDASTTSLSDAGPPPEEQASVYAHTASELYRVDPDTLAVTLIGTFTANGDQITDIAVDKSGRMIGISFGSVYRIDPNTASATLMSNGLSGEFNGLSFVPAPQLGQTGDDVLVATRNSDGQVFKIDAMTGAATPIGNMSGFSSSGDLVSVAMLGTLQTADNAFGPDRLVRLEPNTFAATQIGTDIGFAEIWGIAYWKDKVFGFTSSGEFITIDPVTGVGTLVQGNGPAWWGAAVTTLAPVIL